MATTLEGGAVWGRRRRIGHYGGALDKRNSKREKTPYAWTWYQELKSMRGSGFRREQDGLYHAENVAIARVFAGISRAAEKLVANSVPLTADERLGYWVEVQAVPVDPDDTRQEIRVRCAAKYRAPAGPTEASTDGAVSQLLGTSWVKNWRQRGSDLATPPTQTFWPTANPGPSAYDLGGGAWLSERAHLVVEVQQLPSQTNAEFLRLMNVHLFGLLDRMLNSDATFNWAIDVDTGFALDVGQLDFTGFNP